jgi:cell division protein ZapA
MAKAYFRSADMATVTVTIAGRSYRITCGDGEEAHLTGLADLLDGKIADMRGAFGEIGDMRLHVMAALAIADELSETRRKFQQLEQDHEVLTCSSEAQDAYMQDREQRLTIALSSATERIERLAKTLARQGATSV